MSWQQVAIANGCKVEEQVPMSTLTSFRVGGPADYVVTAPVAFAPALLAALHAQGTPVLPFGNGSNILAGDGGYRGVLLRIAADENSLQINGTTLYCEAGVSLKTACLMARDAGLSGLEPLFGIPGTIGGAVYMNAGAYGGQIADVLESVTVTDQNGNVQALSLSQAALGYRHSRFMHSNELILSANLKLRPDDPTAIRARMDDFMQRRRDKQPLEFPSAGSFFKRPEGHFAGALIDQCGLRGFTVGGAQISEKHAGFLINRGDATCRDILALSQEVSRQVMEKTGVQLECEVRLVGEMV